MSNNRNSPRRVINLPACVKAAAAPHLRACVVVDVSETGAKLEIDATENLPQEFEILLSRRAPVIRHCRVVWQADNQVGVHFEKLVSCASRPARLLVER